MSRYNPWTFAMVFLAVFAIFAWNGFEFPRFLMGEKQTTTGKVVQTFIKHGSSGEPYQRLKYVYAVDNEYYFDFKTIGQKYGAQYVGNRIEIEYLVNNPKKNKVIRFFSDYNNLFDEKFHTNQEIGLSEISFINGIYRSKEQGSYGKLLNADLGEFDITKDSLKLNSFLGQNDRLFVVDTTNNSTQLIDQATMKIYVSEPNNDKVVRYLR